MARIVNVSENNYRVRVQSGGNITLDTGDNVGEVRITGNLIVQGDYTTINVSDMKVEDNVIVLNNGETGSGITEGTSGLDIDRGQLDNAQFLFDESITHYDPYTSTDIDGTFVLKTADGHNSGLQLSTLVADGSHNLYVDMQDTTQVVELINIDPDTYANEVFGGDDSPEDPSLILVTPEDNYIVNKRYVKLYIQSGVVSPGMADVDKIYKSVSGDVRTRIQAYPTDIQFYTTDLGSIDPTTPQLKRVKVANDGLTIVKSEVTSVGFPATYPITYTESINLYDDTITNYSSNLILTASTNNVILDGVFNLTDQITVPIASSGKTKVFSRSQLKSITDPPGNTGIFFANTITTDELVSKNRALLFSMLF